MAMKQCPVCGEKYSDTYRKCPFCEEEEALKDGGTIRRRGKRTSSSQGFSLVTPTLIVLILVMGSLLVYLLYGDQISAKLRGEEPAKDPSTEQSQTIQPVEPSVGSETDPATTTEPGGTETTDPGTETAAPTATDYERANALPGGLTLNKTDFTLSNLGETYTLRASGGAGTYTWISQDEGIASVGADGKVTAVSGGTTNVLVTDGSKKAVCIVRVRASGRLPAAPSTGSGQVDRDSKLNREDMTLTVGESFQLNLSGVTTALTWTSSDAGIASVASNGLVKGISKGTATVTVTWDGQSRSCIVRVK